MKIKPTYPRQIFEKSYKNGLIIGSMVGLGVGILLLQSFLLGLSMLILALFMYWLQNK